MKKIFKNACDCTCIKSCFKGITVDSVLLNDIKQLELCEDQELFVHEMINKVMEFTELGFIQNMDISVLNISAHNIYGAYPKSCPSHNRKTCRCMRKVYIEEDYYVSKDRNFPKGTVIGTWKENPFSAVKDNSCYSWFMNPDLYDAPRFVVDFINQKLKGVLFQLNFWAKVTELKLFTIYYLNVHINSKHYL